MSNTSNTSGTSDASQNNGIPTKRLFKPPFLPGAPAQNDTSTAHPQYTHTHTPTRSIDGGMSATTSPQQDEFQIPPFMLADMQKAATGFPSTDPVVNLNRREEHVKIDTFQHVALSSMNSYKET